MDLDQLLWEAVDRGASDLHLRAGVPPTTRIDGSIQPLPDREPLTAADTMELAKHILRDHQVDLDFQHEMDVNYSVRELGRFRVNIFTNGGQVGVVLRIMPPEPLGIDDLNLPPILHRLAEEERGLVLVTGITGSGKSTTLAAMINHINDTRKGHIITIEDPVEFIHTFKSCSITQREVGPDSPSFHAALRDALREDPDAVLVGEMRDLETIQLALTAAETGVQVFGTLHTNGAVRSIDRLISVFPARVQDQIRSVLADSLRMVVSQQLARKADGSGRVVIPEVLLNTQSASSMIRTGKSHQLQSVIQAGGRVGMCSLDAGLEDLVRREVISGVEAYERAIEKTRFERYLVEAEAIA